MNFILILLFLIAYFIPSIFSGNKNKGSVIVVNLFLGWTIIGWVVALAMALSGSDDEKKENN